jgi:hypothetical protein
MHTQASLYMYSWPSYLLVFGCHVQPSWFEQYPAFYDSDTLNAVKKFVRSHTFEKIVIGMLLINAVAVFIETTVCYISQIHSVTGS